MDICNNNVNDWMDLFIFWNANRILAQKKPCVCTAGLLRLQNEEFFDPGNAERHPCQEDQRYQQHHDRR